MPYRHILVGTDGSDTAVVAERAAGALASSLGADLTIVTAYEDAPGEPAATQLLEAASRRAGELGVSAKTEARLGKPTEAINTFAEERGVDLIVVGDVGMGGARRFKLGGVPDQVAHHTPVDFLVVKTTRPESRGKGRYEKILVATDGSFTADQATGRGYGMASALGAAVTLLYVGDELIGNIVLRDTADRLDDDAIEQRVVKGDPADRICELAQEEAFDLIVVGNKGMMGTRRFLLAAVPNKVAHEATCDVLVSKTVGRSLQDLKPGEGGIVDAAGQKIAAYVEDDGTLHTVSAKCQHLGCTVGWNSRAKTWDCPCHGSRYQFDGAVLNGPTTKPLPPVDVSAG